MEFGGSNVRACYNCLFSRPLNLMFSLHRYNSSLLRFSPSMRGGNAMMASSPNKKNIRTIITTPPNLFALHSQNWYQERDGHDFGARADQKNNVGGEAGHQARECPKRGTPVCYNCGQDGHMSRDCTSPAKEKSCYRCGQSGHLSRECSEPAQAGGNYGGGAPTYGGQGGQGGSAECYKCGKVGHIARQCTSAGGMQQQGGYASAPSNRAQTCYSCGGYGHLSRDCTQGQKCYNCGQIGHLSRDCPSEQDRVCYKCKQPGHVMAACPEGQSA